MLSKSKNQRVLILLVTGTISIVFTFYKIILAEDFTVVEEVESLIEEK